MLQELKLSTNINETDKVKLPTTLMSNLEEYLVRCGICEPFDKMYLKATSELLNMDIGRMLAVLLISQLPKLQLSNTTG